MSQIDERTPRLVVAVLVFILEDDALLLARQRYGKQYWSLPGGVVEVGESLEQAALREIKEETGLEVQLRRVVGLYSKPQEGSLAVTFEGERTGGTLQADNEISACGFFAFDDLPAPIRDHLPQRIADFRAGLPNPVVRAQ